MVLGVLTPGGVAGAMVIGARLRELREERKLSQGDITEVIGLPRSYISRIENGHAVPSLETLQRLAAALDVPLYRLFYTGQDAPNGRALRRSLEELAEDTGPAGGEARFLIEMRDLTKKLGGTERIFLLNLARKLAARKSEVKIQGSEAKSHRAKSQDSETRGRQAPSC
jgi:transcriptional regulator with XRE-family HTH domain